MKEFHAGVDTFARFGWHFVSIKTGLGSFRTLIPR